MNEGLVITPVSTPIDLLVEDREHSVRECEFVDFERNIALCIHSIRI